MEHEINQLSQDEQIAFVTRKPTAITWIKNPSEAVQMAAVENGPYWIIQHIIQKVGNPSEQVQLMAAKKNGWWTLKHLLDDKIKPSKTVSYEAIKQNGDAIQHLIDNKIKPSDELIILALQGHNDTYNNFIEHVLSIKNLSEPIKIAIVKHYPDALYELDNPSEQVCLAAMTASPLAIEYVDSDSITPDMKKLALTALLKYLKTNDKNSRFSAKALYNELAAKKLKWPELSIIEKHLKEKNIIKETTDLNSASEAYQILVVTSHPETIKYIYEPSEAVQLAAVKAHPEFIQYIYDPYESVKIAAVENIGTAIQYIKTPSEAVQLAAVKKSPYWALDSIIERGIVPSEAVQLAAVQGDGAAIYWLIDAKINPSLDVQLAALRQNGHSIMDVARMNPNILSYPEVKRLVLKTMLSNLKERDFVEVENFYQFLQRRVDWPELETILSHMEKYKYQ
jgi:bifunctional DNase/RNase